MGLDLIKKLKGDARARQQHGSRPAPKHEPSAKYLVSSNWKNLVTSKPTIAPKAHAVTAPKKFPDIVALDCEMVGAGPDGMWSVLARISIIDGEGLVLMDRFVMPDAKIKNYRTHITGITAKSLAKPGTMREKAAKAKAAEILEGKIIVGHGLSNDFKVLQLEHPAALIRDTSLYKPLRPVGKEHKLPSLERLTFTWLHEQIHQGTHDSVEDARCALRLYRLHSRAWELQMRNAIRAYLTGSTAVASDDEGVAVDEEEVRQVMLPQEPLRGLARLPLGKVQERPTQVAKVREVTVEEVKAEPAEPSKNLGKKARKKLKLEQAEAKQDPAAPVVKSKSAKTKERKRKFRARAREGL